MGLLEQMPSLLSGDEVDQDNEGGAQQHEQPASNAAGGLLAGGDLLDLDIGVGESSSSPVDALADLLGDTSVGMPSPQTSQAPPAPQDGNATLMDMLGGTTSTTTTGSSGSNPLDALLGGGVDPMQAVSGSSSFPSIQVYEKNGVSVDFSFTNSGSPGATTIKGLYKNASPNHVSGFVLQAAVPKYIQLRLDPASGNQLPSLGSGSVQQQMHVVNSLIGQKPLMMRLKIGYLYNGNAVSDMIEVKNFPTGL